MKLSRDIFTSGLKQIQNQANALRRDAKKQGLETGDIDKAVKRVQDLEQSYNGTAQGAQQLEGAMEQIIEQLKVIEFSLRRQMLAEQARPVYGGNADVPAEYRKLVADYYRSLAEKEKP